MFAGIELEAAHGSVGVAGVAGLSEDGANAHFEGVVSFGAEVGRGEDDEGHAEYPHTVVTPVWHGVLRFGEWCWGNRNNGSNFEVSRWYGKAYEVLGFVWQNLVSVELGLSWKETLDGGVLETSRRAYGKLPVAMNTGWNGFRQAEDDGLDAKWCVRLKSHGPGSFGKNDFLRSR